MKRNKIFSSSVLIILLLIPGIALASGYQSPDSIIKSAFEGNIGSIFSDARDLFMGLVGIEVVWFFANMVLNQRDFYYTIQQTLLKVIIIGLYYKFLLVAGDGFSNGNWFYDLIHGMAGLGESLGGGSAVGNPSSIMNQGLTNALNVLEAPMKAMAKNASWWNVFSNAAAAVTALELTIMVLPAAIGILLAYALMSLRVFMIDVEMYFVLSAGILLLGTGGSRWTSGYAKNYVNYVVSVSIRFFAIYFILGVCNKYVDNQTVALTKVVTTIVSGKHGAGVFEDLYSFAMDYFSIALLILMVPKFAAALASGSSSAGVGDILKPAAMAAGTLALGAGAAAAGTLGAARAAGSALNNVAGGTVGGGGDRVMSAIEAAAQYQPPKGSPFGGGGGFGAGGYVRDGGGGGSPFGSSGGGSKGGEFPKPELPPAAIARKEMEEYDRTHGKSGGADGKSSSRVTSGSGGPQVTTDKGDDVAQGISAELATDAAEASAAATSGDTPAESAFGSGNVSVGSGGSAGLGSGTGSSKVSHSAGGSPAIGSPALGTGSGARQVSTGSGGSTTLGSGSGASRATTTGGDSAAPKPASGSSTGASTQPELTRNEKLQKSIDDLREAISKMGQGKKPTVMDKAKQHYETVENVVKSFEKEEQISVHGGPNMGHLGSE